MKAMSIFKVLIECYDVHLKKEIVVRNFTELRYIATVAVSCRDNCC